MNIKSEPQPFFLSRTRRAPRHILFSLLLLFMFVLPAAGHCQDWIYTVQPGDNAWNLGKKYLKNMQYWARFKALNNIGDPEHVAPGTKLRFQLDWLKSGATMATVLVMHGDVTVIRKRTGTTIPARQGMFLWPGDEIRTGPGGNVTLQFADSSKSLLQQESVLELDTLMSYGGTGMADTRLRLKKGRTDNRVIPKKGPGSRFEIRTPAALAAVRGTRYRVNADGEQMQTEVSRGEVLVSNRLADETVRARFGTVVQKKEKPMPPIPLLPPPDLSALPTVMEESPFMLRFPAVTRAVGYRLQVATNQNFDVLLADYTSDKPRIAAPELQDGNYALRLRAIDKNGLEGLDALHTITLNARPLPPIRVKPEDGAILTDPRPTFLWSAPKLARSYIFQLADNKRFDHPIIDLQEYGRTTLKPDRELSPGTYYWRVAGRDAAGKPGPMGMTMQFRVPVPAPDMNQSKFDAKDMVFRWQSAGPDQRYRIQIAADEKFSRLLTDSRTDKALFKISSFEPGDYYIRVATIEPDDFQGQFSAAQHLKIPSQPNPWSAILVPLFFIGTLL